MTTLFVPHSQWGIERLAKIECGAKILAENGEREGVGLGKGVAVKLSRREGHLRAQNNVCRVGHIIDEGGNSHRTSGRREGDFIETRVEIGEDISKKGSACDESACDRAFVKCCDADTAIGERDTKGLDEGIAGVQREDDAVVGSGDSQRDDGLGVAEEREQGSAGKLERQARGRGRVGGEERSVAAEDGVRGMRRVDRAQGERGWRLPRELELLADLRCAVDHARQGADRTAVGDYQLHGDARGCLREEEGVDRQVGLM